MAESYNRLECYATDFLVPDHKTVYYSSCIFHLNFIWEFYKSKFHTVCVNKSGVPF